MEAGATDEDEWDDERDPIEELVTDFLERRRNGEDLSVDDYASAHPDRATEIRDVFPAMLALEKLKQRKEVDRGGQASLGAERIRSLGEFSILREVGRGGMGIVYEAVQESLGRRVAVKVLPRHSVQDAKRVARFRREALTAANLHHPHIVPVFGFGESGGLHYCVMQFIEGDSLETFLDRGTRADSLDEASFTDGSLPHSRAADTPTRVLPGFDPSLDETVYAAHELESGRSGLPVPSQAVMRSEGRLSIDEVIDIGIQTADALDYAHGQRVLHRDIKPANLIRESGGHVWIADFGLAKAMEDDSVSQTGDVVGTLRYIAPERLRGEAGPASDQYSLGLTLYELLAGEPAFQAGDQTSLLQQVTTSRPARLRSLDAAIPADLETVIFKAIEKDPSERYATAGALRDDLVRVRDGLPIRARRVPAWRRFRLWARRNPGLAFLSCAVVLLSVAVLTLLTVDYRRVVREKNVATDALTEEEQRRVEAEAASRKAVQALSRVLAQIDRGSAAQFDRDEAPAGGVADSLLSDEELETLETLLAVQQELAETLGDQPGFQADLAAAFSRMGTIYLKLGRDEEAESAFRQATARFERLTPDSGSHSLLLKLSVARNGLALSLRRQDRIRDAQEILRDTAEELGVAVDAEHGTATELKDVRLLLAETLWLSGQEPVTQAGPPPPVMPFTPPHLQPPETRRRRLELERAVALLDEVEPASLPRRRYLLGLCRSELSGLYGGPLGDEHGASAIELLSELAAEYRRDARYARALIDAYLTHRGGNLPTVRSRLQKAWDLSGDLLDRFPPIPEHHLLRVEAGFRLGGIFLGLRLPDEGRDAFEEAATALQPLLEDDPDSRVYRLWDVAIRISIGRTFLARVEPEYDPARECVDHAIETLRELVTNSEALSEGRPDRVLGMIAEALELRAWIKERTGESPTEDRQEAFQYRSRMRAAPRPEPLPPAPLRPAPRRGE